MNLIVAADAAWGIGKDGEQMVYIAPDLKRWGGRPWRRSPAADR